MSLTGDLGFVSLPEVLRLLIRSGRRGAVSVAGNELSGRVFIADGGIALSTTSEDSEMAERLVKAGLVDDGFLGRVESGEATLASIAERSDGALTELLREVTVESLYQLGRDGGAFDVQEGETTLYGHPRPFELEGILEESERRLADWAEVSRSVGDLNTPMRVRGDLGDRSEISIDRDAWRVLSRIGAGSTVSAVADELGMTAYWAARVAAGLVADGLIGLEDGQGEVGARDEHGARDGYEARDEYQARSGYETRDQMETRDGLLAQDGFVAQDDLEGRDEAEGPIGLDEGRDEVEAESEIEAPSWAAGGHEDDDEEIDYSGSWWRESTGDESTETVEEGVEAHEPTEEQPITEVQPTAASDEEPPDGAGEERSQSRHETLEADDEDGDDDTDAFLAKVFSELEAP